MPQLLGVRTFNAALPILGREGRASTIAPADDDRAIDAEEEGEEEDEEDEEDEGEDADEVSRPVAVLLTSLGSACPELLAVFVFSRKMRGNSPTSSKKKRRKRSSRARPWTSQPIEERHSGP